MKQKLKIIVYLALAAIVFSCAEEKDFVKEQNHSKIKMEEKSFKELLQFPAFNEAYRKVVKSENVMSNEFMARTALEEQYGFDIVATSPVKVITDAENGVFYIMLIERPIIENLKFENLIINIKDFEIGAVIMKYEMANLPENIEEHNSYKLTILSTEMTALEVESRTLFGGCVTTATLKCNDTRGNYPPNHDASTFCIENSNNLYYTWNTVCEGMDDSAGGNGPSSSSGSSTSSGTHTTGGTTGNGTTGDVNSDVLTILNSPIPPVCTDCPAVDAVEDPCEELKKLANNNSIQQTLRILKGQSTGTQEYGNYVSEEINSLGANYLGFPVIPNNPNNPSELNIDAGIAAGNVLGVLHCHTVNGIPMFSPADLRSLRRIARYHNNNGLPKNYAEYTVMLSVGSGHYALKFKDFIGFHSNFGANFDNFNSYILELYEKSGENCTSDTLIKIFLSALKKYSLNGVGLFKADVTTILNQEKITSWKEQTLDTDGNIFKIPCN